MSVLTSTDRPRADLRWGLVLVLVLAVVATSCTQVLQLQHVSALRDLQDDFSAVTEEGNAGSLTLGSTAEDDDERAAQDPARDYVGLRSVYPGAAAERYHRRYYELFTVADGLLNRASAELTADELIVPALTLRVLARWKMAFFGHVAAILRGDGAVPVFNPSGAGAPESLNAVVVAAEDAQRVIGELRGERGLVYPRDEFILKALAEGPLVRYDIAYLGALRAADAESLRTADGDANDDVVVPLIEGMAQAEEELAGLASLPAHLRSYVATSRILMLRNAYQLFIAVRLAINDPDHQAKCPRLVRCLRQLHADFATDGDPARVRATVLRLGKQKLDAPPPSADGLGLPNPR